MTMKDVEKKINQHKTFKDIDVKDILEEGTGYAHEIVKDNRVVGKKSRNLKTAQLRKFFFFFKKMEHKDSWKDIESDFYLLKPRMAIAKGRGNIPGDFFDVIMAAMAKVDNIDDDDLKMENFKLFIKFFEAIIAYHKYEYPKAA